MRSGEGMIIVPRWKSGKIGKHYSYRYEYKVPYYLIYCLALQPDLHAVGG